MSEHMLKIVHTADWHLGHRLHGVSRKYEHKTFLNWFLKKIEEVCADVLIIAGDIFDSANPPATAQSVFYDFLIAARKSNQALEIIIVGGNHDSASRLDAPSQILQSLGIRVIGGLTRRDDGRIDWQRLLVPLTDSSGEIRAICGAMPFIRTADLPQIKPLSDNKSNDPLIIGVAELYQQLFEQMQLYKAELQLDDSIGQIMTGHCYMVGTELSELSERRILGGNQHALPASIFNKELDYVALGHLHKAQKVSHCSNNHLKEGALIQYSGSPLPLSFTERNYKHQISLVTYCNAPCNDKSKVVAQEIIVPRAVPIMSIPERGYAALTELEVLIAKQSFDEEKAGAEICTDKTSHVSAESVKANKNKHYPMLEVKVELEKPEPDIRQKIEILLAGLAVRLLKISVKYPGKGGALADKKQYVRLEELHPEDVFQQCYQRSFEQNVPDNIAELFQQLVESVEAKQ